MLSDDNASFSFQIKSAGSEGGEHNEANLVNSWDRRQSVSVLPSASNSICFLAEHTASTDDSAERAPSASPTLPSRRINDSIDGTEHLCSEAGTSKGEDGGRRCSLESATVRLKLEPRKHDGDRGPTANDDFHLGTAATDVTPIRDAALPLEASETSDMCPLFHNSSSLTPLKSGTGMVSFHSAQITSSSTQRVPVPLNKTDNESISLEPRGRSSLDKHQSDNLLPNTSVVSSALILHGDDQASALPSLQAVSDIAVCDTQNGASNDAVRADVKQHLASTLGGPCTAEAAATRTALLLQQSGVTVVSESARTRSPRESPMVSIGKEVSISEMSPTPSIIHSARQQSHCHLNVVQASPSPAMGTEDISITTRMGALEENSIKGRRREMFQQPKRREVTSRTTTARRSTLPPSVGKSRSSADSRIPATRGGCSMLFGAGLRSSSMRRLRSSVRRIFHLKKKEGDASKTGEDDVQTQVKRTSADQPNRKCVAADLGGLPPAPFKSGAGTQRASNTKCDGTMNVEPPELHFPTGLKDIEGNSVDSHEESVGPFVVAMPTEELRPAMNITEQEAPEDSTEFQLPLPLSHGGDTFTDMAPLNAEFVETRLPSDVPSIPSLQFSIESTGIDHGQSNPESVHFDEADASSALISLTGGHPSFSIRSTGAHTDDNRAVEDDENPTPEEIDAEDGSASLVIDRPSTSHSGELVHCSNDTAIPCVPLPTCNTLPQKQDASTITAPGFDKLPYKPLVYVHYPKRVQRRRNQRSMEAVSQALVERRETIMQSTRVSSSVNHFATAHKKAAVLRVIEQKEKLLVTQLAYLTERIEKRGRCLANRVFATGLSVGEEFQQTSQDTASIPAAQLALSDAANKLSNPIMRPCVSCDSKSNNYNMRLAGQRRAAKSCLHGSRKVPCVAPSQPSSSLDRRYARRGRCSSDGRESVAAGQSISACSPVSFSPRYLQWMVPKNERKPSQEALCEKSYRPMVTANGQGTLSTPSFHEKTSRKNGRGYAEQFRTSSSKPKSYRPSPPRLSCSACSPEFANEHAVLGLTSMVEELLNERGPEVMANAVQTAWHFVDDLRPIRQPIREELYAKPKRGIRRKAAASVEASSSESLISHNLSKKSLGSISTLLAVEMLFRKRMASDVPTVCAPAVAARTEITHTPTPMMVVAQPVGQLYQKNHTMTSMPSTTVALPCVAHSEEAVGDTVLCSGVVLGDAVHSNQPLGCVSRLQSTVGVCSAVDAGGCLSFDTSPSCVSVVQETNLMQAFHALEESVQLAPASDPIGNKIDLRTGMGAASTSGTTPLIGSAVCKPGRTCDAQLTLGEMCVHSGQPALDALSDRITKVETDHTECEEMCSGSMPGYTATEREGCDRSISVQFASMLTSARQAPAVDEATNPSRPVVTSFNESNALIGSLAAGLEESRTPSDSVSGWPHPSPVVEGLRIGDSFTFYDASLARETIPSDESEAAASYRSVNNMTTLGHPDNPICETGSIITGYPSARTAESAPVDLLSGGPNAASQMMDATEDAASALPVGPGTTVTDVLQRKGSPHIPACQVYSMRSPSPALSYSEVTSHLSSVAFEVKTVAAGYASNTWNLGTTRPENWSSRTPSERQRRGHSADQGAQSGIGAFESAGFSSQFLTSGAHFEAPVRSSGCVNLSARRLLERLNRLDDELIERFPQTFERVESKKGVVAAVVRQPRYEPPRLPPVPLAELMRQRRSTQQAMASLCGRTAYCDQFAPSYPEHTWRAHSRNVSSRAVQSVPYGERPRSPLLQAATCEVLDMSTAQQGSLETADASGASAPASETMAEGFCDRHSPGSQALSGGVSPARQRNSCDSSMLGVGSAPSFPTCITLRNGEGSRAMTLSFPGASCLNTSQFSSDAFGTQPMVLVLDVPSTISPPLNYAIQSSLKGFVFNNLCSTCASAPFDLSRCRTVATNVTQEDAERDPLRS